MTQAVVTRRDGDTFQARMFWLHAAHLLDPEGRVTRVGFEAGPRGFDDIWVEYDPAHAPKNQFGNAILVERMQCKWHATGGYYTFEDLTLPAFINAAIWFQSVSPARPASVSLPICTIVISAPASKIACRLSQV